ncbi:hypothetical protein [Flindersiella endophytica]
MHQPLRDVGAPGGEVDHTLAEPSNLLLARHWRGSRIRLTR